MRTRNDVKRGQTSQTCEYRIEGSHKRRRVRKEARPTPGTIEQPIRKLPPEVWGEIAKNLSVPDFYSFASAMVGHVQLMTPSLTRSVLSAAGYALAPLQVQEPASEASATSSTSQQRLKKTYQRCDPEALALRREYEMNRSIIQRWPGTKKIDVSGLPDDHFLWVYGTSLFASSRQEEATWVKWADLRSESLSWVDLQEKNEKTLQWCPTYEGDRVAFLTESGGKRHLRLVGLFDGKNPTMDALFSDVHIKTLRCGAGLEGIIGLPGTGCNELMHIAWPHPRTSPKALPPSHLVIRVPGYTGVPRHCAFDYRAELFAFINQDAGITFVDFAANVVASHEMPQGFPLSPRLNFSPEAYSLLVWHPDHVGVVFSRSSLESHSWYHWPFHVENNIYARILAFKDGRVLVTEADMQTGHSRRLGFATIEGERLTNSAMIDQVFFDDHIFTCHSKDRVQFFPRHPGENGAGRSGYIDFRAKDPRPIFPVSPQHPGSEFHRMLFDDRRALRYVVSTHLETGDRLYPVSSNETLYEDYEHFGLQPGEGCTKIVASRDASWAVVKLHHLSWDQGSWVDKASRRQIGFLVPLNR